MKNRFRFFTLSFVACLLFLLILFLFPGEVLDGGKRGINLWFQIVLPTLLPFLIATSLCMELRIPELFSVFLYPVFTGLLSGVPVGAKTLADLCNSGRLSLVEGQFFLIFCNNASPMFVLNYLFYQTLSLQQGQVFLSFFLFYGSTLLSALFFFLFHKAALKKAKKEREAASLCKSFNNPYPAPGFFSALDTAIMTGCTIITKIGGYILLFSIFASLIFHFLPVSSLTKGVLISLLEITTGLSYLSGLSLSKPLLTTLAVSLTVFGGGSSVAQTASVLSDSGLSVFTYIKYKALAAGFAAGLCILYFSWLS
jgi:hypothetical protein